MRKAILAAMALALIVAGGCQSTKTCQCPSEVIYLRTENGMYRFEAGELDQEHDYILHQSDIDELMEQFQKLYMMKNGGAS
jgi:type IV pilus biogenesis protein CpaD/CtpE